MSDVTTSAARRRMQALAQGCLVALMAFLCIRSVGQAQTNAESVAKPSGPAELSNESLVRTAILGKDDRKQTAKALWLLFQRGKEVKAPREIWLQGPPTTQDKWENEDFFALQNCRLSKLNEVQYVFYGSREAKQYLYLLHVRRYLEDKPRFVILAGAMIVPEWENDPGIRFDHPSVWDMPEPGPAQ